MRALGVALGCMGALSACSDPRLFIERTWPASQALIVVIAGADDAPIDPAPRVFPPGAIPSFSIASGTPVRFSFRSYAAKEDGGPDLEGCGVRFGGPGAKLPAAAGSWSSGLIDPGSGGDLTPAPDPSPRELDLRFERCFEASYPCDRIAITPVSVGGFDGDGLFTVVAVSDTLAFFAGSQADMQRASTGRIDVETAIRLPPSARAAGRTLMLSYDGAETIHGITSRQIAYTMSTEGVVLSRHVLTSTARGISAGLDGAAFVFGEYGVRELAGGSTVAGALSSLNEDVQHALIVRRDRAIALTDLYMYFFNGTRWSPEYTVRPSGFEKWDNLGGDDAALVAVDRDGQVLLRSEEKKAWSQLPRPLEIGPRWRHAAGMGGGRLILVGDDGNIAVWTGESWCTSLLGGVSASLRAVSVSPSRKTAYVVGEDVFGMTSAPVAFRVSFPDP